MSLDEHLCEHLPAFAGCTQSDNHNQACMQCSKAPELAYLLDGEVQCLLVTDSQ